MLRSREFGRIEETAELFSAKIANDVYSTGKSLEQVVADILTANLKTIAVAESCTGGLLCHRLTDIPGSSKYLNRGIIAYSNAAKVENLGVSTDTIRRYGAVSAQCAREMALGIKNASGSDIGVATTGIAGPTGSTPLKALGLVYVGYADCKRCVAHEYTFVVPRETHKERSTRAALYLIWRYSQ